MQSIDSIRHGKLLTVKDRGHTVILDIWNVSKYGIFLVGMLQKSKSCRMDILINKTQIYFVLKAMCFIKQLKRFNIQYSLHNKLKLFEIQFLIL